MSMNDAKTLKKCLRSAPQAARATALCSFLVVAGAVASAQDPLLESTLSAFPNFRVFSPSSTGGFVCEVFNDGTGILSWGAELVPGADWHEPSLTPIEVIIDPESLVLETSSRFHEGQLPVGSINITLPRNVTSLVRRAVIRITRFDENSDPLGAPLDIFVTQDEVFGSLRTDYQNVIPVPDPLDTPFYDPVLPVSFFNGHVDGSSFVEGVVPNNFGEGGDIQLISSAFGQPVGFSNDAAEDLNRVLFDTQNGVFRYRDRLFGADGRTNVLDATNTVAQQAENRIAELAADRDALLDGLFGDLERLRLVQVNDALRDFLRFEPQNRAFRDILLDTVYYQAMLNIIKAKEKMVRAFSQRIFPLNPLVSVIDNEVGLFEDAIQLYNTALDPYFNLWNDSFSIDVNSFDPSIPPGSTTFGLFVFQQEVPFRPLFSSSFLDKDGELRPVDGEGDSTQLTEEVLVSGNLDSEVSSVGPGNIVMAGISILDSAGIARDIGIEFTKTADINAWTWAALFENGMDVVQLGSTPAGQRLTFNLDGSLFSGGNGTVTLRPEDVDDPLDPLVEPFTFRVDFFDLRHNARMSDITTEVTNSDPPPARMLFSGFKDLALIFESYKAQPEIARELVKLYALRGGQEDLNKAKGLIRRLQTSTRQEFDIVSNLIPNWRETVSAASNIFPLALGVEAAISELTGLQQFLEGNNNVLGFDKDFLLLIQAFPIVGADIFDTFNQILQWNDPNNSFTTPFGLARDKLADARESYFNYRATQDDLMSQFRTQNLEYRDRLREITGVDPGQDIDNPPSAYLTASSNPGGELNLQQQSIDIARTGIEIGNAEGTVLQNQIDNERAIIDEANAVNSRVEDIFEEFANKRGSIELALGIIEGTQKLADNTAMAMAEAGDFSFTLGLTGAGGFASNGVYQLLAETLKGGLRWQQETLNAEEQSQVRTEETGLENFIRAKNIDNLLLQAAVCNLQGQEATQMLGQEQGRLLAIQIEKRALEQRMRENNEALVGRFFADPLHRLLMQADTLEAQAAFEAGQRWAFFAVQALEYKWNTPFILTDFGRSWTADSVFSVRNAEELELFVAAMVNFDGFLEISRRGDDRFDWLSFTEDILGFPERDDAGKVIRYRDPDSPLATLTAKELFQRHLAKNTSPGGIITVRFNTARDFGGTFFRGPRFDDEGNLIDRGMYLDKIVWMKINMPGAHSCFADGRDGVNTPVAVEGTLTYGGTSFVRNSEAGSVRLVGDTEDTAALLMAGEMTAYPARFWYWNPGDPTTSPPIPAAWRVRNGQPAPIKINLCIHPEEPETVEQIDVFKELSVAASDWTLTINTKDRNGNTLLNTSELDDIEILFFHTAKDRP